MLLRGLQEVTLRRKNSDDRLGLTLYYRDAYNGTSDVIVGEVSKPAYLCEYSSIPRPTVFMRPSSLGGGRIMRRTLSVCPSVCLSVCLSVCPSVRPVIVSSRRAT